MHANLLGRFQNTQLRYQILLLVLLAAVIPPSIVVALGPFSATRSISDSAETVLQFQAEGEVDEINAFLSGINRDVLVMSEVSPIQGIIRARANGGTDPEDGSSYEEWVNRLQVLFANQMKEKTYYMQLRYLDEAGNELVRVDSDGETVEIIPQAELQNKADRGYFTETMALAADSVYVSPVDLNREQGVIEEPYKPVIRYATPIVDAAGEKKGIVIANVFASNFIDDFSQSEIPYENVELLLVNQDGYYLYHPDSAKMWGADLETNETLTNDLPADIAARVLSEETGVLDVGGDIFSFQRFVPNSEQPYAIIPIIKAPKSTVFAAVNSFRIFAVLMILASLLVVIPLAMLRGKQLVKLVDKLTAGIATSSQEMATTIAEQERVASQQAASVNETTTTMDELEASSRHAAEQAGAAVEAAKLAFKASEAGAKAVEESLQGMTDLTQKVEAIADQIVNLSDQASQIDSISQLVMDFATQTNMLALNSSVEAVRAGEHGRGFAVVADEIRKLADQSQKSADKISTLVSEIQKSINKTVMVTEEGTKTVKAGMDIAQRTDGAFNDVKEAVNQVVLNNQQISLNLKQQVDAIAQVVDAMDVINRGAKETATGLYQTKAGTEKLNEAALILQRTV